MNVIFLDIDGVLNNCNTRCDDVGWRHQQGDKIRIPIEPLCIERLNRLVAETGAKVVISSSWRMFADFDELGLALAGYGLVADVVGETPDVINDPVWMEKWRTREGVPFAYERLERGMEIQEYLDNHPEVTNFVILDDCQDMAHLRPWLVLTDPCVGLDDPDVERAKFLMERGLP